MNNNNILLVSACCLCSLPYLFVPTQLLGVVVASQDTTGHRRTSQHTMVKKKPFINRKNASTYHLMHRSQRDVSQHLLNEGDTHASAMILWPSPQNNPQLNEQVLGTTRTETMKEWREKLQEAGLLEEEQAPYMKEISGTGTFLNQNGRITSATQGDLRAQQTDAQDLDMLEVKGQMDNIPLVEALDEEMAAILYGDNVDVQQFEELNDEFIFDAAKEPEPDANNAFDYDAHIRQLMEKAKREREGGKASDKNNPSVQNDQAFFSKMKPLHERDDEDDSFAEVASDMDGTEAYTALTTTPGVVPKLSPDEERALCEKFAETLLEYDSDEIGDDPYEEIGGDRPLQGDKELEAALDDFLVEKQDDILIYGNREGRKGGSGFSVLVGKQMVPAKKLDPAIDGEKNPDDNPPVKEILAQAQMRLTEPHVRPPEEVVLIDGKSYFSEKIRNPWDCESILSTYSNLDNNPVTIGAGSSRRRKRNHKKRPGANEPVAQIQLSNKTGLPLGVLGSSGHDDDDDDDESNYFDGGTTMSVNRGLARTKNETPEEKRARKAALKQERQMARIQKKVTREIFQEEFAKRAVAVQADDVGGKTVFRYS